MSDTHDNESTESVTNYLDMPDSDVPDYPPESASDEFIEESTESEDLSNDSTSFEEEDSNDEETEEQESTETDDESDNDEDDLDEDEHHEEASSDEETAEETDTSEEDPSNIVDYKAAYEQVFAPFKANGRDIQVDTPEDAVRLMQMGANYAKKMEGLKPHLKLVKMLSANNLLDESKLNLIIDASAGNKEAIKQLATNTGVELDDINSYEDGEQEPYVATDHTVSDENYAMQVVLDDVRDTPTYKDLLKVVTQDWSSDSRDLIQKNPDALKTINDHIGSGIYSTINSQIEDMKLLGKYPQGVPEVEVYGQIFQHMQSQEVENANAEKTEAVDKRQKQNEANRKTKRNAVTSTKKSSKKSSVQVDNILDMSDDEFSKMSDMSLFNVV